MKVILLALVAVSIFSMSDAQYKESYYDRGNNSQNSYANNGDEEQNHQNNHAQNTSQNNNQDNENKGKEGCPYCSGKSQNNQDQNQNRNESPAFDLTTPAKVYEVDRG